MRPGGGGKAAWCFWAGVALAALPVLAAPDGGTRDAPPRLVQPASPCGTTPCVVFPSAAAAFKALLKEAPLILAVGEYHQVEGQKARSAVRRFTTDMLPALKGKLGSLVVETWISSGKCGQVEKQVTTQVAQETKRPAQTEDEVTTLMYRAHDLGAKNHILTLSCEDQRSLLDEAGELDPAASLALVKAKVEALATRLREEGEAGLPGKLLLLYGGALHNDVEPAPGWEPYTFGPTLLEAARRPGALGYLELDLLVPEYVEKDADLKKTSWFAPALKLAAAGRTVLVRPRLEVAFLLFPRGVR